MMASPEPEEPRRWWRVARDSYASDHWNIRKMLNADGVEWIVYLDRQLLADRIPTLKAAKQWVSENEGKAV